MKVSEIQQMQNALNDVRKKKLPVKLSFVLSRNLKKMDEVVNDLEEKRNELIEKYGERGEDGNLLVGEKGEIKVTNANAFMNEMMEVLNADIEITLDSISEEDIEKCDRDGYDNLTVEEVGALENMIAMEDPE